MCDIGCWSFYNNICIKNCTIKEKKILSVQIYTLGKYNYNINTLVKVYLSAILYMCTFVGKYV